MDSPSRRRLPEERSAITHKFSVGGVEGYVTVGMFPDGAPGEVFIYASKQGSTFSGLMDGIALLISLALQYGVPLSVLVQKFKHTKFDPSGLTERDSIPEATSVLDYIFRWLEEKFLTREDSFATSRPHAERNPLPGFPGSNGGI